ncbi:MAG TPA: hypothetical protein VK988_07645 [Acidimicrobiales bacterium]|nr:hypothetical protein [Acidimicrobiales bacterium]
MRGGEVDRVIAPKTVPFGELTCTPSKLVIDLDEVQLAVSIAELFNGDSKMARRQPTEAVCLGQSRTPFGIDESGTDHAFGGVPKVPGTFGSGLCDEQGNHGRCIEIGDHRR